MLIDSTEHGELVQGLAATFARREFTLLEQPLTPLSSAANEKPFRHVLLRFREEEDCRLPPGLFLHVLNEHHLVPLVDRWVVGHLAGWIMREHSIYRRWQIPRYGINLCADTIHDGQFLAHLHDTLAHTALPSDTLSFEISLATVHAHSGAVRDFARALRRECCAVCVGDYDASASSPALLASLLPDFLKIHPRLVYAAAQPHTLALIEETVRECRALGIKTIAEDVEHEDIVRVLRELGLDFVQGWPSLEPQPIVESSAPAPAARPKTAPLPATQ